MLHTTFCLLPPHGPKGLGVPAVDIAKVVGFCTGQMGAQIVVYPYGFEVPTTTLKKRRMGLDQKRHLLVAHCFQPRCVELSQ